MTQSLPKLTDWRTETFVRTVRHELDCDVEHVLEGSEICDGEVYISASTLDELINKTLEWAKPQCPTKFTYRDVLTHSGKYHAFVGVIR